LALRPGSPEVNLNIGNALKAQGDLAGAIACFRKAIELDPQDAQAHISLGALLNDHLKDHQGTVACYRKASELDPKYADAHCNLGRTLKEQGEFATALAALQAGHELGSKRKDWPYPSEQWVQEAKRLVELEPQLPDFLNGKQKPTDAAERLGFAKLCYYKKLYTTAARLYAEAFVTDAKLADDLNTGHRHSAAVCAALAGCGQGDDANKLDEAERVRLRRQALEWLWANLAQWAKQLESGQALDRTRVQCAMRGRQSDPDLAGVRDATALDKLSAEEREAWRKLWADAEALLQKGREMTK
jgi:tetratricopeptide (TPR) repeat protein